MIGKIISITFLVLGALISYLARFIAEKVPFIENTDKNVSALKIMGFIIVLLSTIYVFMKF